MISSLGENAGRTRVLFYLFICNETSQLFATLRLQFSIQRYDRIRVGSKRNRNSFIFSTAIEASSIEVTSTKLGEGWQRKQPMRMDRARLQT